MLTAADLAGFDLPNLATRLQDAAIRQDRCRRQAARFDLPIGFEGTRQAVTDMDTDAAAIADGARLAAVVLRFVEDEGRRRPAPVTRLHIVPRSPAPRIGLVSRLRALFARPAPTVQPRAARVA